MLDSKFERVVARCFATLVNTLRFSELKDRFRTERLISREEYSWLSSLLTEEERARRLLNDILPKKGPGTYDKFRQILLSVKGQAHIVSTILDPTERKQSAAERMPLHELEDISSESSEDESCNQPPNKKKRPPTSTSESSEADMSSSESEEQDNIDELHPFLDKPVSDKHTGAVEKLGNDQWRPLARALKFQDPDISCIASKYEKEGNRELLHQVIYKWRAREGVKGTLRKLLKACRKSDVGIYGMVVAEIKAQKRKKHKKARKSHHKGH